MTGEHQPLPKAIRAAAGDQNLTRSDIGRFMGLSHTTVGEWFSGKRTPTRDQLIDLERILMVEPGHFCVLAGFLPEGNNPKVERTAAGVVVRLESAVRRAHNPRTVAIAKGITRVGRDILGEADEWGLAA